MPAPSKKRKVSSTTAKGATSINSIGAFTRVSKAAVTLSEQKSATGSKRKATAIDTEGEVIEAANTLLTRTLKPLPQRQIVPSPKTPQKAIRSTSPPTTSREARDLFDHLFVSSKNTSDRSPSPKSTRQELPSELLDLINLHAAFLTALSLHYAHNGTHSPADLRVLCPDIARVWGKRKVLLDDIRRTLGVMNSEMDTKDKRISKLSLSDYGQGKICVEIEAIYGKASKIARPVNEDLLNDIFTKSLKARWNEKKDATTSCFIAELPLEAITTCASLLKMSPLLAKGQRRLEDMKIGITVKKHVGEERKPTIEESTAGKKLTLLERLRAKQLHQATLPPPATKEQLSRRAALQRIDEVAEVLRMLSTSSSIGQQRISFTLPTVLSKLRDSFKTPMSREEGDICVRLLAAEIAPSWVQLVKMGKTEALVVNRDERPSELDIKERVKRAG